MSDNDTSVTEERKVTDLATVLMQHNKGLEHRQASVGLDEIVQAALATGKKGGTVTVKFTASPLDSGSVSLAVDVKVAPAKDPANSIWFTDGEGELSRTNSTMFYGSK